MQSRIKINRKSAKPLESEQNLILQNHEDSKKYEGFLFKTIETDEKTQKPESHSNS